MPRLGATWGNVSHGCIHKHPRPNVIAYDPTAASEIIEAANRGGLNGRKVMGWFSQKTSIAGVQIPNWGIVLGAVVVILLIYSSMH